MKQKTLETMPPTKERLPTREEAIEKFRTRTDTLSAAIRKPDEIADEKLQHIAQEPTVAADLARQNPLLATYLFLRGSRKIHETMHPPAPRTFKERMWSAFQKTDYGNAAAMTRASVALRSALSRLRQEERDVAGVRKEAQLHNAQLTKDIYGGGAPSDGLEKKGQEVDTVAEERQRTLLAPLHMPESAVKQLRYVTLAMAQAPIPEMRHYLEHILLPLKLNINSRNYEEYHHHEESVQFSADTLNTVGMAQRVWTNDVRHPKVQNALDEETRKLLSSRIHDELSNASMRINDRGILPITHLDEAKHESDAAQ